jgi:hypothetical protein
VKKVGIHLIHQPKLTHILQEDGRLDHLIQAAASRFQDGLQVCEGLRACAWMPPSTILPVAGSIPTWPAVNTIHTRGNACGVRSQGFGGLISGDNLFFVMATTHFYYLTFLCLRVNLS